jgi:hypothetical protein
LLKKKEKAGMSADKVQDFMISLSDYPIRTLFLNFVALDIS